MLKLTESWVGKKGMSEEPFLMFLPYGEVKERYIQVP